VGAEPTRALVPVGDRRNPKVPGDEPHGRQEAGRESRARRGPCGAALL